MCTAGTYLMLGNGNEYLKRGNAHLRNAKMSDSLCITGITSLTDSEGIF